MPWKREGRRLSNVVESKQPKEIKEIIAFFAGGPPQIGDDGILGEIGHHVVV